MIKKINWDEQPEDAAKEVQNLIDQLVDAVNGILAVQEQYATIYNEDIVPMLTPQNEEPHYITTTYTTDGKQKKYYGQNGACVETGFPLPAGYVITIIEPETKGGTMIDMKCPICNEPMKEQIDGTCISYQETNCICNIAAPKLIWKELERTRKALETIRKEMSKETMPDFAVICDALKGVSDE